MNTKRGMAQLLGRLGLCALVGVSLLGLPQLTQASPGCQALNVSGSLGPYQYVQLLTNDQQVNAGDAVTLTTSGSAYYGGSWLQMVDNGGTVSGTESGSGAGADNLESNESSGTITYSITCTSVGATVSSVSPAFGTSGTTVILSGSGLWGTTAVSFGGIPATNISTSYGSGGAAQVTVTAPNGAGSVPISVTTDAGTFSGGTFTFTPPTANPVSAAVSYNSSNNPITLNISGNATSVAIGTTPAHGTARASGTSITYTPAGGYSGPDSFTYSASNAAGMSAPAMVAITVNPPPAPTVVAVSATTQYNTATNINLTSEISGAEISAVTVASGPSHGTASVSGNTVTYTPASTFYGGTDSFTYTATNPGGTSLPATVTITVGQPGAPTAAAASATTPYNTAASINLASAIAGVDITAVNIAGSPSHGTVSVSGETVTYTPSSTFYGGTDSFTYTATNPTGTSAPATVTVTVGQPGVPTAAAASATTPYNTVAGINLASAIAGVDITAVNIAGSPSHGTVSVSGETVTYTPSSTFYGGTDSFTYTATNPSGTSMPATVTVAVGHPAIPTVAAASATTPYDTATSINLTSAITGVDVTALNIASSPSHGTVSVSGETVTYTPSSTFYGGTDSFTYTAINPSGHSAPATITVTVTPLSVPNAAPLSVVTSKGTNVLIDASAEANSTQPLTGAHVATQPTHGTATASGEQILYTPAAGFVGTDTFGYQLSNHFGASTPGTITVTVTAAGTPAGLSRTVTTQAGSPVSVNLASVASGTYVSSALLGLSPASAGNASVSQPATLTFTPTSTFHGLVQITAVLIASNGQSQIEDVLVLVNNQPDPSRNPDVLGLVEAQAMQAERFAQDQLSNIQSRLDSLHDGNGTASFSNNLSISMNGKSLQAPTGAGANGLQASNAGASSFPGQRSGMGASESMDGAPAFADQSSQGHASAPAPQASSGLGTWVDGTANFGAFDAYRQAAGFDSDTIAVNTGVDQRIGEHALIGISVGYNHDNSEVANDGTRSVAKGYSAALYGSYQPTAHMYVDGVVGGGGLSFDSSRYAADSQTDLIGHRNGDQWFASLTAGYEYHAGTWTMSPYGRFAWSVSSLNSFSETGDVTDALTYGAQTLRTSQAIAGFRASGKIPFGDVLFMPHVRLELGHGFQGTTDTTLSYAFVPSAGSWNVLANPYSANGASLLGAFGGDFQIRNDLQITTEYQYILMPHSHDQGIQLGLHKQF